MLHLYDNIVITGFFNKKFKYNFGQTEKHQLFFSVCCIYDLFIMHIQVSCCGLSLENTLCLLIH